jgi:hypothetical protein
LPLLIRLKDGRIVEEQTLPQSRRYTEVLEDLCP